MNTKFNEKDVPSWCRWIAVDKCGDVWAYEIKPFIHMNEVEWDIDWKKATPEKLYTGKPPKNWKDELYTWS